MTGASVLFSPPRSFILEPRVTISRRLLWWDTPQTATTLRLAHLPRCVMNLYISFPSNPAIDEANNTLSSTGPSCHIWQLNYPLPSISPSFHMWRQVFGILLGVSIANLGQLKQSGFRPFRLCCAREFTGSGYQVAQYNVHHWMLKSTYQTSYDSVGYSSSRSVAPTPSQGQVDQPNELPSSILRECPVCKKIFYRVSERNRHLESYLPHSIHCPSQGCNWTGRRQPQFKEHWEKAHSKTDKAPGKELNIIYDPKEFVKLIVDGKSPVEAVALSAFLMVRERLVKLGKRAAVENVWGRSKEMTCDSST